MSYSWFIARRYLRSRKQSEFLSFITAFTVIGITLGTAALIITLSILSGFEHEIKDKVIGFTSHIQIVGFQNRPLLNYQQALLRVEKDVPGIKALAPFVGREAMIRSHEGVDGVYLKGIDPNNDISITKTFLTKGRYLSATPNGTAEIIIGKKLADKLNVDIGDKLVLFGLPPGTSGDLQPRAMQCTLVGIYESGMAEYDDIYAYTTLTAAEDFYQLHGAVTGIDVLADDINRVDQTTEDIQKTLGYPYYARSVFQSYHNLFSWVELQKKMSPILLSLIIVVATVNIIGTILMFVLEKSRAIGVLKSMGATPKGIRRVFMLQGITMTLNGIVAGNILAFLLCWIQMKFKVIALPSEIYYMNAVPIRLEPLNFAVVTLIAFLLCMVTTYLPARAAAKLDPVITLRFG
jgi:lipoprotein-releasing system permease protein